jgi:hypothetical protein
MVLPDIRRRAFDQRLEEVVGAVGALSAAAQTFRRVEGRWPDESDRFPRQTAGPPGGDLFQTNAGYRLGWLRWERVEIPATVTDLAAPRIEPLVQEIGGIQVISEDTVLVATLLDRFGRARSFVRDSVWTLLLRPSPAP